jgi:hypothetical protein
MITTRESPRFNAPESIAEAAAKPSNHSLAVAGRSFGSFASAFMIAASSSSVTSKRSADKAGGA